MHAIPLEPGVDPYEALENGNVLLLPEAPLAWNAEELDLIRNVHLSGSHHKNISYKPARDKLCGLDKTPPDLRRRFHGLLQRFSRAAVEHAAKVLPRYARSWHPDYASFRPVEEAGRRLPFKKRNDLLHTDAFPTRPTRGGLILRMFTNLHPSEPRVWIISDPFEVTARIYAAGAGLDQFAGRGLLSAVGRRLRHAGLPLARRSPYDRFMLAFHDYLKRNSYFQSATPRYRLEFPPGATWIVFTDVVPHAVESGQFAMEQTMIVARDSLAMPERAPIAILEKLAGRPLL